MCTTLKYSGTLYRWLHQALREEQGRSESAVLTLPLAFS